MVLSSGTYRYGVAYAEKDVQGTFTVVVSGTCINMYAVGDYTIVVSSFNPKELGAFALTVESSVSFTLEPIPQEGAGMYSTTLRGAWYALPQYRSRRTNLTSTRTEATAGGSPSSGRFHLNPTCDLHISAPTTIMCVSMPLRRASYSLESQCPFAARIASAQRSAQHHDLCMGRFGTQLGAPTGHVGRVRGAYLWHSAVGHKPRAGTILSCAVDIRARRMW